MSIKKKVNRYTRASKMGKNIFCPLCNHANKVYHFCWSAITCQECKEIINKNEFYINNQKKKICMDQIVNILKKNLKLLMN